jgi:hypothetical protein
MKIQEYLMGSMCFFFLACNIHPKSEQAHTHANSDQNVQMMRYHEDAAIRTSQRLFLQNLSEIMSMPLIVDDENGLHIRIWLWDSDTGYAITLKLDSLHNECNIVGFYDKKIDTAEYIVIKNDQRNLKLKDGWKNIHSALIKFNILTMATGKTYKEHKEVTTHMTYVQFEVARVNEYKYYEYLEPSYYRYVDTESMNIYNFLEYLNEQLGVQIYKPANNMFIKPG